MSHNDMLIVIKRRRERAHLSQEQLAILIGVSRRHYVRCEAGQSELRLSQYIKATKALHMTQLDVALDLLGFAPVTAWDVAAAARTLTAISRKGLIDFLMMTFKEREKG